MYRIYTGTKQQAYSEPVEIPATRLFRQPHPDRYLPSAELIDAMNVALHLGQPLLLTGEPGTGKTQFAYSVAWELGFGEPLKFETKSNSEARDLFYAYNSIGRFHAAQTKEGSQRSVDYITYNALGLAILCANEPSAVAPLLPADFEYDRRQRSVVLIDEVDKAPREFANDILNEIEGMYFRIPELDNTAVTADASNQPIVIITSNSEQHLPDAFLRRCVYHHIEFPAREELEEIVLAHLADTVAEHDKLLKDVMTLFYRFRDEPRIRKTPATAELLGWLYAIHRNLSSDPSIDVGDAFESTIGCIAKTPEGQEVARDMVNQWIAKNET